MGYNIEVSIDILRHTNISEVKKRIADSALDFECNHYYYLYEMEGECKIPRNHCIMVINFDDEQIFNCAEFLKLIKRLKIFHIECIYEDDIVCNLIYASKYYQTTMGKDRAIKYNKFKRERSLSDNEKMILEQVSKKPRSSSISSTDSLSSSPASSPASLTVFSASL
jgi:hypothetical protein